MPKRDNQGGVEELRVIVSNLDDPYHFLEFLGHHKPADKVLSNYNYGMQSVYFGKKLVNSFNECYHSVNDLVDSSYRIFGSPSSLFHLEAYGGQIEAICGFSEGYLTKCKADLLVMSDSGEKRFYSIKLGSDQIKKPGQISGYNVFGQAVLGGVFSLSKDFTFNAPPEEDIKWEDTALSGSSYKKLKERHNTLHLRLAYFKKHSRTWNSIVRVICLEAENMLLKFSETLLSDRASFIEFFIYLLRGPNPDIEKDFYIMSGGKVYHLPLLRQFLEGNSYTYNCFWYGKSSLVISVEYCGRTYVLAKIQFSFEGADADVSQTKGVVFHAQEWKSNDQYTLWDLIEVLSSDSLG
jgi:hypothetical protein